MTVTPASGAFTSSMTLLSMFGALLRLLRCQQQESEQEFSGDHCEVLYKPCNRRDTSGVT